MCSASLSFIVSFVSLYVGSGVARLPPRKTGSPCVDCDGTPFPQSMYTYICLIDPIPTNGVFYVPHINTNGVTDNIQVDKHMDTYCLSTVFNFAGIYYRVHLINSTQFMFNVLLFMSISYQISHWQSM